MVIFKKNLKILKVPKNKEKKFIKKTKKIYLKIKVFLIYIHY